MAAIVKYSRKAGWVEVEILKRYELKKSIEEALRNLQSRARHLNATFDDPASVIKTKIPCMINAKDPTILTG